MLLGKRIAIVGSRKFGNYQQLAATVSKIIVDGDSIVSGGAVGADSMAQRFASEWGCIISIHYPNKRRYKGSGAYFARNKTIVEQSDIVLAFYAKGSFQQGGTANTVHWAKELNVPYFEYEELLMDEN